MPPVESDAVVVAVKNGLDRGANEISKVYLAKFEVGDELDMLPDGVVQFGQLVLAALVVAACGLLGSDSLLSRVLPAGPFPKMRPQAHGHPLGQNDQPDLHGCEGDR